MHNLTSLIVSTFYFVGQNIGNKTQEKITEPGTNMAELLKNQNCYLAQAIRLNSHLIFIDHKSRFFLWVGLLESLQGEPNQPTVCARLAGQYIYFTMHFLKALYSLIFTGKCLRKKKRKKKKKST